MHCTAIVIHCTAGMLGLEAWPRSRGQILLALASTLASGCLASVLALVSRLSGLDLELNDAKTEACECEPVS